MRFGVSLLNFRPGRIGGAETYVRKLLHHLPRVCGGDELVLVAHREASDAIGSCDLERVVVERSDASVVAARVAEAFTPWRDLRLERLFAGLRLDAVLFPQQSIFPKRVPAPAVLTVVDVQHLFFPHYFGAFDRALRATIYPYSLRRAQRIVCISEYTRATLIERASVAPDRALAVPFGFEPSAGAVEPHEGVPRPYLYYPAATYPHKGHARLFRSLAALHARDGFAYSLVLSGQRTKLWASLERLARELGIGDRIVHLGFRPWPEIRRVYAGASAVVFPTEFEGFGLPVLEAVAHGRKVITSRLPVFDEIGVPRRFQIDFSAPDELASALALPGSTTLEKEPWGWDDCARATLEELRRANAAEQARVPGRE